MLRRPRARPEGRAHVALRGGRQRGDRRGRARRGDLPRREPRAAHRRAGARPPGRPARGGHDRRPLPGAQAGAGLRRPTQEIYTLYGMAVAGRARHAPAGRRRRPGHDRLPVRAAARRRRGARSACWTRASPTPRSTASSTPCRSRPTTSAASARCTSARPRACRSRSTRGTLLEIVEDSMSSEIYELMKRVDEAAVVEKAHRRPRFVEDCVREMIGGVLERLPDLPDDTFVSARQENLETIHQHNVAGRAPRHARRAARGARQRRALAAAHDAARLARGLSAAVTAPGEGPGRHPPSAPAQLATAACEAARRCPLRRTGPRVHRSSPPSPPDRGGSRSG